MVSWEAWSGAARRRSPTASTTWVPTVRPKRDSQARCRGSLLRMVPVASPSLIRAPWAFASVRRKVSLPSSKASSRIGTVMVCAVSPGAKVRVPLVAV